MKLPNNFRISVKYFLLGAFIGVVSLFFQVKPVEAFNFNFPGFPDLPGLFRLLPFPALPGLKPLPTLQPLGPFQNPFDTPTPTPTATPTSTPSPTQTPTSTPTNTPTPTLTPTPTPTETPFPTETLTPIPTDTPIPTSTQTPTPTETLTPTPTETPIPTVTEIPIPTETQTPTLTPTPTTFLTNQLLINEVFPGGLSATEWVELFNPTINPIDASGWSIFDNTSNDTLPSTTPIEPGGYAVIVGSGSTVTVPDSAVKIQLSGAIGGGLASSGDDLILKDSLNNTIDAVSWGSDTSVFATPPAAPVSNQSLVRLPNGTDTDTASDWSSSDSPSIGVAN